MNRLKLCVRRTMGRAGLVTALLGAAASLTITHAAAAADSQGRAVLLVYPVSTTVTEIASLTDHDTGEDVLTSLRNRVTEGYNSFKRFHIEQAGQQFPNAKEALISAWVLAMQGRPEGFSPAPDFAVIPVLTSYRFQQGTESETIGNTRYTYPTMEVELEASCIYIDFEQKKVLAVLEVEGTDGIRVTDSSTREQMVADATFFAARELAANIVARSRQIEQFRLRPKIDQLSAMSGRVGMGKDFGIKEGDYFFFDDGKGAESGYAIVTNVGANSSSIAVISSPSGQPPTLAEANKRHEARSYGAVMPLRNVYGDIDPADPKPRIGKALELGFTTTSWEQGPWFGSDDSGHWRTFSTWSLSYIMGQSDLVDGKGFGLGYRTGMGYQLFAAPWVGLSVTPYAGIGLDFAGYFAKGKGAASGSDKTFWALPLQLPLGALVEWHGLGSSITPFVEGAYDLQLTGLFTEVPGIEDKPNWGGLRLSAGFTYRGDIGY